MNVDGNQTNYSCDDIGPKLVPYLMMAKTLNIDKTMSWLIKRVQNKSLLEIYINPFTAMWPTGRRHYAFHI